MASSTLRLGPTRILTLIALSAGQLGCYGFLFSGGPAVGYATGRGVSFGWMATGGVSFPFFPEAAAVNVGQTFQPSERPATSAPASLTLSPVTLAAPSFERITFVDFGFDLAWPTLPQTSAAVGVQPTVGGSVGRAWSSQRSASMTEWNLQVATSVLGPFKSGTCGGTNFTPGGSLVFGMRSLFETVDFYVSAQFTGAVWSANCLPNILGG